MLCHWGRDSISEALSVMLPQAAMGLAVAEAACGFEHRDLHWGNVLLSRDAVAAQKTCRLRCAALGSSSASPQDHLTWCCSQTSSTVYQRYEAGQPMPIYDVFVLDRAP